MKVLVTGNLGYIGTVLTELLVKANFSVAGLDIGYFKDCKLEQVSESVRTNNIDIRDISIEDVLGFDSIVHLAALSNDPVGQLDEKLTYDINQKSTINLAKLAKKAGVRRFVYISTQSIYGISNTAAELDEYISVKNPQTAYAKSKWRAENELKTLESTEFEIVYIRPSTVFGWSPRLRTDIVFNNLLLTGLIYGEIRVHSDGSPWRPIVHVRDLSSFILLTLMAEKEKVSGKAFNVGVINGNYTVKEIAEAANSCLPKQVEIIYNTENTKDQRSYKVSFQRAKQELGFTASTTLESGGNELLIKTSAIKNLNDILGGVTNRLLRLKHLDELGLINKELRFSHKE